MPPYTFSPLTPTAFLDRSSHVFSDRVAIIDGNLRLTYREFGDRCRRLAGALRAFGVEPGDRIAALCANSHVMLELHNGVLYAGAILVPLNTRLSTGEVSSLIRHSGAKVLVTTTEFVEQADVVGDETGIPVIREDTGVAAGYEHLISSSEPVIVRCEDEKGIASISYTSGTTGRPKGVMYHHRGAYLQSLATAYHAQLDAASRYLWTLPQFHCNGWCFTWAVTAAGGTHVCLRSIDPEKIWHLITTEGITHFSGAPTVLAMIADWAESAGTRPAQAIQAHTGGAPPSPTLLERLQGLRVGVTHLYGLTETYGPAVINEWHPEWNSGSAQETASRKARQGVGNIISDRVRVIDTKGVDVPADGRTVGEVACRGNNVMLGYYLDPDASSAVEIDGWFRTGDLAVMHPDGYAELRDRAKDIIISGGENIASVEIERVLDAHPAVAESAVVGRPDQKWGEVPVAFVALRAGKSVGADELIQFVREQLAHFKAPKEIVFGTLPKTSTGKIQKGALRLRVRPGDRDLDS